MVIDTFRRMCVGVRRPQTEVCGLNTTMKGRTFDGSKRYNVCGSSGAEEW